MKLLKVFLALVLFVTVYAAPANEVPAKAEVEENLAGDLEDSKGEKLEGAESAYISYYGLPYYPYSIYKPYIHHPPAIPVVYVG